MNLDDYLTGEERKTLKSGSDWRGFLGFLTTWTLIFCVFLLVAQYPHVLTVLVSLLGSALHFSMIKFQPQIHNG